MQDASDADDQLVGLFEVAEMAGVSRTVIANWRTRDKRFPSPVADLRSGPVFQASRIRRYLKRRKKYMAYVISTINLKGGVGKTTTTVGLAEFLSAEFGKRVLVIDLDPQTNLTTVLIGEKKWKVLNDNGHTLATLFQDALRPDGEPEEFDLEKTLQRNVSPVKAVRKVDLLPSSLDLIDVQDRLATMSSGRFYSNNPTDLLRKAVRKITDDYDYVLVDCPPNLGIVTLNGLRISDGYIIPTIPDVLSTYGIPQIQRRVRDFAEGLADRDEIVEIGIVVTKYRANSTVHQNTVRRLKDGKGELPTVLSPYIPERDGIAASAEFTDRGTLRQKYGYRGEYDAFRAMTKEFIELVKEKV
ncbi:AAA family ATPase [Streptomyces kebangsaanensis]|uniref:AAA family ATPase n=1 Tax=Streptomyces kebangsaanensis TaxID=864058 RepID=UPI001F2904B3|nr:AAA family ATPase [Streptomyces kebangsaanensis]